MSNVIDFIDEKGNLFIDTILKPLAKGSKNILIDDNKIVKSFLTFKTAFIENKLSQFIEFINQNQEHEIIDFIENLSSEEKTFFIETLNKVIDLDDSLQIYLMAYLTKQFKKNKELNYYEKQLFYNINTLSEDDFKIFFCMYKEHIKPLINNFHIEYSYKNKAIIEISLNKFSNLGLLNRELNFSNNEDKIKSSLYFYTTDYSEPLYQCLDYYFNSLSCAKLLDKEKNQVFTRKLYRY